MKLLRLRPSRRKIRLYASERYTLIGNELVRFGFHYGSKVVSKSWINSLNG